MCPMFVNVGQMDVRLNDEPLEGVDPFEYLGSHVEADGGCELDV